MTTAARPTFEPAKGGENDLSKLSKQYSSRDLPGQTKIKYRQPGQSTHEDVSLKDFKRELEEKERNIKNKSKATATDIEINSAKRSKLDNTLNLANLDADDPIEEDDDDIENRSNDDEEEEMAELMAELQRIKKERAFDNAKKEMETKVEQEKIRTENILSGNPLLNTQVTAPGFKVKRRWDDDVVFKNCAKGDITTKPKQFINDIVRSDFHRRFMEKYIR
ncbi:unnamed protein product [Gordionus sp. m RMFG-2023]|uniref:spliceosome-associated protein CWC15 homolog n=1 Tax=Gordionus sp. m RMFG-2023 TaxID=3053472 RepID=UPI0030DDE4F0